MSFLPLVRSRGSAYAGLGIVALIWGTNWIWLRMALEHVHPIMFNVHRIALSALVLFAIVLWQRKPVWPDTWLPIVVTGVCQVTISFLGTTMALIEGGVGRTSTLVFTMPFWTLLIARLVLGERIAGLLWLAVALAFAGLMLVVAPWDVEGALAPRLWAILSGFGWAAGTVAVRYFQGRSRLDMRAALGWQLIVGSIPFVVLAATMSLPPTNWTGPYALMLGWTAVIAVAVAFVMWMAILRYVPAGTASLNMFAVLVIALLAAVLVFDEKLPARDWIGIGLISAGLAILGWHSWNAGAVQPATPTGTGA